MCSAVERSGTQCCNLAGESYYCPQHTGKHAALQASQTSGHLAAERPSSTASAGVCEVKVQCCGTTVRGRPCKTTGFAPPEVKFYCPAHIDQAPAADSSSDDEDGYATDDGMDANTWDDWNVVNRLLLSPKSYALYYLPVTGNPWILHPTL